MLLPVSSWAVSNPLLIPVSSSPAISVVLPTHNPRPEFLPGLLRGLAEQTLAAERWELVVVDNASLPALAPDFSTLDARGVHARLVREPRLGLTQARLTGFADARADLILLLDDDNHPSADLLSRALAFAAGNPRVGVFGGKVLPRYAVPPPSWFASTGITLGCRDLGDQPLRAVPPVSEYPRSAPIGAGMVLRASVARRYADHVAAQATVITDRRGTSLSSGGDCEIVLVALAANWEAAYAPDLLIEHIIPAARLDPAYLCRLNHDATRSWVMLLHRFSLNRWPPVHPATLPLRLARAWLRTRPWRGPRERIHWAGIRGLFAGRADLHRLRSHPS